MDLQTICEEVDLDRCTLGINTVIPVDHRVQNGLAQSVYRIFCPITASAGFRIDNSTGLHVALAETQRSVYHVRDRAFNSLVVQKTGRIRGNISDLCSRDNDSGDRKLREKALGVYAEI